MRTNGISQLIVSRDSTAGVMNQMGKVASNDVRMRAEESLLLGTITKQQLVKTITDKDSMCYCDLLSM